MMATRRSYRLCWVVWAAVALGGCRVGPAGEGEWVRTELYFGMQRRDGSAVGEVEWQGFLDGEVTPRFPAGLTVLRGEGQYRGEDGRLVREGSRVVVLLYPRGEAAEAGRRVDEVAAVYVSRFDQESVLRADSAARAGLVPAVRAK